MTRLCVPIFLRDRSQAKRDCTTAIAAGADIIELRLDALEDAVAAEEIRIPAQNVPLILTCRSPDEGGQTQRTDAQRLEFLETVSQLAGHAYVDIELATLRQKPDAFADRSL